jgi:diacylglycerol O-acyltransferase
MSRVDTAWLRMDNDVNLMMIVGVWLLAGHHAGRAARAHRRQAAQVRALPPQGRARRHGRQLGRGRPTSTSTATWRRTVAEEARPERAPGAAARAANWPSPRWTPRHPLWQFHLVERLRRWQRHHRRIHHCIGDGIALISVMQSITDGGSDPPKRRRKTPTTTATTTGCPTPCSSR